MPASGRSSEGERSAFCFYRRGAGCRLAPAAVESDVARWDDLPWVRKETTRITAGTVAAVVMTGMLFVILFALVIAR